MFVRFRPSGARLQVSLIETRRRAGRASYVNIATLGRVPTPPSVEDRVAFWAALQPRLAALGSRLDKAAQARVLTSIDARIPMPSPEDQQRWRIARVRDEVAFWDALRDGHAGVIEAQKAQVASLQHSIAAQRQAAAKVNAHATAARQRLARAEAGDIVETVVQPLSTADAMDALGWTSGDLRHPRRLAAIEAIPPAWSELMAAIKARRAPAERPVVRHPCLVPSAEC